MKIYKVSLYKCTYDKEDSNDNVRSLELTYVDEVIVKKRLFKATELITGYNNIDIRKDDFSDDFITKRKMPKDNSLMVFEEDFNENNLASIKDLDDCVENYAESNWKKVYEEMNNKVKVYNKK